jgi:type I protein arginine methyltransferase
MSFRLPSQHIEDLSSHDDPEENSGSSGEDVEDDQTWDDWISDSMLNRPCKSLFDDQVFPSVGAATEYDRVKFDFDLEKQCSDLGSYSALSTDFFYPPHFLCRVECSPTDSSH